MAKFEEIIKLECERGELTSWLRINLHVEGKFCHAYEQSAWLYTRFAAVPLTPTRHKSKQFAGGSYVIVGHPPASINKYKPDGSELQHTENLIVMTLPESSFPKELTPELLETDFEKWKQELSVAESKTDSSKKDADIQNRQSASQQKHQPKDTLDVMRQIIAYPLDNRTPIETIQFVSDLKRQLSFLVTEIHDIT